MRWMDPHHRNWSTAHLRRHPVAFSTLFITTLATLLLVAIYPKSQALLIRFQEVGFTYRSNLVLAHTPHWARWVLRKYLPTYLTDIHPWPIIPGVLEAPHPSIWELPTLTRPTCLVNATFQDDGTPALALIHIFSAAMPKQRLRRDILRSHPMLHQIPVGYRHLFEVKFIVGHSHDPDHEAEIIAEAEEYGDMIRLDGLLDGENMDQGKTFRWIRHIGDEGYRRAWWVFKCDDDTFPVLPNLLPMLLSLDPKKPTYIGTTIFKNVNFPHYFCGVMYGFNHGIVRQDQNSPRFSTWGVADSISNQARTISAANVSDAVIDWDYPEDARTGWIMWNLPSRPGQPTEPTHDTSKPFTNAPPISPDPRTGLIRVETAERMPNARFWYGAPWWSVYLWHSLKQDKEFTAAVEYFEEKFASKGWSFEWRVPWWLRHLAMDVQCVGKN